MSAHHPRYHHIVEPPLENKYVPRELKTQCSNYFYLHCDSIIATGTRLPSKSHKFVKSANDDVSSVCILKILLQKYAHTVYYWMMYFTFIIYIHSMAWNRETMKSWNSWRNNHRMRYVWANFTGNCECRLTDNRQLGLRQNRIVKCSVIRLFYWNAFTFSILTWHSFHFMYLNIRIHIVM